MKSYKLDPKFQRSVLQGKAEEVEHTSHFPLSSSYRFNFLLSPYQWRLFDRLRSYPVINVSIIVCYQVVCYCILYFEKMRLDISSVLISGIEYQDCATCYLYLVNFHRFIGLNLCLLKFFWAYSCNSFDIQNTCSWCFDCHSNSCRNAIPP